MATRDFRIVNMSAGQKAESDKVFKRIGEISYRDMGVLSQFLINEGSAAIMSGLRVVPSSGMTVSIGAGAVIQRNSSGENFPGVINSDTLITMDAASGILRTDMIEAQIKSVTTKQDYTEFIVDPSTGVISIDSANRDIKYYIAIQKKTNSTTPTDATAGTLTGSASIPGTVDLSVRYLINLADGEDGVFQEIDLRGATPEATTKSEIVTAINNATGRTAASISGNYIVLTGMGTGQTSYFELKPPVTDSDKDCANLVFGLTISGIYSYVYSGTNDWFKLAEITIDTTTTTIISDLIKNIDAKSTWLSNASSIFIDPIVKKDSNGNINVGSGTITSSGGFIGNAASSHTLLIRSLTSGAFTDITSNGGGVYSVGTAVTGMPRNGELWMMLTYGDVAAQTAGVLIYTAISITNPRETWFNQIINGSPSGWVKTSNADGQSPSSVVCSGNSASSHTLLIRSLTSGAFTDITSNGGGVYSVGTAVTGMPRNGELWMMLTYGDVAAQTAGVLIYTAISITNPRETWFNQIINGSLSGWVKTSNADGSSPISVIANSEAVINMGTGTNLGTVILAHLAAHGAGKYSFFGTDIVGAPTAYNYYNFEVTTVYNDPAYFDIIAWPMNSAERYKLTYYAGWGSWVKLTDAAGRAYSVTGNSYIAGSYTSGQIYTALTTKYGTGVWDARIEGVIDTGGSLGLIEVGVFYNAICNGSGTITCYGRFKFSGSTGLALNFIAGDSTVMGLTVVY